MFLLVMCLICTVFGIYAIQGVTASEHTSKYVIVQGFAMLLGIGAFIVFTVIDPDLIADKWIYLSIFNVLIIANPYDAFILEDDGRVDEKIFSEYARLGLRFPPRFIQVACQHAAETHMATEKIDLVICMPAALSCAGN